MSNNNNSQDIRDLFSSAVSSSDLDSNTAVIMIDNLDAVALAGCIGTDVDALNTDDVTLVGLVLDESGSMEHLNRDVIEAYNTVLETLRGSKQADSLLLSTWSFSDQVKLHFSYTPVTMVQPLTAQDYNPSGGTALNDAVLHVMTGLVAYGQLLRNSGLRTRGIIVVFSDGDDNSSKLPAQQVRTASAGLLAQETYTLAYAGFGANQQQLQQIAQAIGFPAVITTTSTPSEIRRIFKQVSQSVISVSSNRVGTNSFFTP
jgi:uncharacterized protein YegL